MVIELTTAYRGESQHRHLKSFIGHNRRKNSDFLNTCRGIERSVRMQIQQHRNMETQSKVNIPNRISKIFNEVVGQITWTAVDLVMRHRQKNPVRANRPCTGRFRREMGLPCAHDWERVEESDHQYFRLADFHRHWFWLSEKSRASNGPRPCNASMLILGSVNANNELADHGASHSLAGSVSRPIDGLRVNAQGAKFHWQNSISTSLPPGGLLSEPPRISDEKSLTRRPRSATGRILTANEAAQRIRNYTCSACGQRGHKYNPRRKCPVHRPSRADIVIQPTPSGPKSDSNLNSRSAPYHTEPLIKPSTVNSPSVVESRDDADRPVTPPPVERTVTPARRTLSSPLAIRPSPKRSRIMEDTPSPLPEPDNVGDNLPGFLQSWPRIEKSTIYEPEPTTDTGTRVISPVPRRELDTEHRQPTPPTKPMHQSRIEVLYSRYLTERKNWEARHLSEEINWATYRQRRGWKVFDNILRPVYVSDPIAMRAKTMLGGTSVLRRRDLQGNIIDPNPTWTDEEAHALIDYLYAELRDADGLRAELVAWGYKLGHGKPLTYKEREADIVKRARVDNAVRAERRAHYITDWDDYPNRREDPFFTETMSWNRERWEYYVDTGSFPVS
jgi:hypothetical protein